MPYQVELEISAGTDTGLVRAHNEDSVVVSTEYGFAILADGMGGYNAGEVASGIATAVLKESLEQRLRTQQWDIRLNRSKRVQQMMVESIVHANDSIFEAGRLQPQNSGMGTTLVAALFYRDSVTVAHVGDSRAYRLRKGQITQITRDHSMLQEQIDAGLISEEGAQFAQNRNLITRAMGVDFNLDVEIHEHQTESDDIYVLCSDGLSDMLSKQQILEIITAANPNLEAACDALIKNANQNGGRDNISVILIKVKSKNAEIKGLVGRVLNWIK